MHTRTTTNPAMQSHLFRFVKEASRFQSEIESLRRECGDSFSPWFHRRLANMTGNIQSIYAMIEGSTPESSPTGGKSWNHLARDLGVDHSTVKNAMRRGESLDSLASRVARRTRVRQLCEDASKRLGCPYNKAYSYFCNHGTLTGFDPDRPQGRHAVPTWGDAMKKCRTLAESLGCPVKKVYRYFQHHGTLAGFDPKRGRGRPHKDAATGIRARRASR